MITNLSVAEKIDERSKSERVYDYLRRHIRELDFPPGAPLRKNEIALECGVSRAPVSEAIAMLAAEGLVDVFPQNGSFVSPIRPQDIRESMFIRMALETETVKRVTTEAGQELLDSLEDNVRAQEVALQADTLDLVRYDDLDEAFHALIIDAVHSARVQNLLDATRVLLDRPRFLALPEDHRPENSFREHRRIADAIATGDPDLAAAAMRVHLTRVSEAIEVKLRQIEANSDE